MNALIGLIVILVAIVLAFSFPIVGIPLLLIFVYVGFKSGKKGGENKQSSEAEDCRATPDDWRQPFGTWKRKHHLKQGQDARYSRSIIDEMELLWVSDDGYFSEIRGTQGIVYNTTLSGCTCPDYEERLLPCKHIYLLARHIGKI